MRRNKNGQAGLLAGGLVLALCVGVGCELITSVDHDKIPQTTGGAGGTGAVGGDGGVGNISGGGMGAEGGGGSGGGCADADRCPAPVAECRVATCDAEVCGEDIAPEGTACMDDMVCNAAGDCVECNDSPDCTGANPLCQGEMCVPDHCGDTVLSGDETDVDCGGSCSGCDNGEDCAVFGDCASGVCTALVCVACVGDGDCMAADTYCDAGVCSPQKMVGVGCGGNNECLNDQCVDAFCCDTSCDTECQGCAMALTAMPNGTCSQYSNGQIDTTFCSAAACTPVGGGNATPAETCQAGTCSATPQGCGGHVCTGAGICPTTCANDTECLPSFFCSAGNDCVADQPNGGSCQDGAECTSGNCSGNTCCNTPCAGACDQCSTGTCALVGDGLQGTPSCTPYLCDGAAASCPTTCQNSGDCAGGTTCSGPGGTCS